jgi:hypothetical protein
MYFSIKAFSPAARRFENLDSIAELNDFVSEFTARGFRKFIVKAYDENGARSISFFSVVANHHIGTDFGVALGTFGNCAVRIAKKPLIEE